MKKIMTAIAAPACAFVALAGVVAAVMLADPYDCGKRAAAEGCVDAGEVEGDELELLVTGYCNCGKCCGWRKKWFFFGAPVYDYGKMRGLPKKVGVTASGSRAMKGTIAADPAVYPFGTKMHVPGYGAGIVQDIGGAIKGAHIDIWFPSHDEALAWGARRVKVRVAAAKK